MVWRRARASASSTEKAEKPPKFAAKSFVKKTKQEEREGAQEAGNKATLKLKCQGWPHQRQSICAKLTSAAATAEDGRSAAG